MVGQARSRNDARDGNRTRGQGRGRGRGRGRGGLNGRTHGQSTHDYSRDNGHIPPDNQELNSDLPERFNRGRNQRQHVDNGNWSPNMQSDIDLSLNLDIRKYMQAQANLEANDQRELWVDTPEIPVSSEMCLAQGTTVNVIANKVKKKFKSVRSYLKTHYSLLREDAVGPLRDAIDKFRTNPGMQDDEEVSIYEKVHISGFTFTNVGIAARLKFSTRRAGRRILWSASKRLVSGSLVALTPATNNFANVCIVGIIAARPLAQLERSPPEVDILFGRPEDIEIDPQVEYVMVEAKHGYFEAYRYTLKALQKMSKERFPLSPQVTGSDTNIGAPEYLAGWSNRSLVAVVDGSEEVQEGLASVDIIHNWPPLPQGTTLDSSQWDALKQILTKKVAIIQGPPGTGKTHVSKIALQVLVQNRVAGDPPIIIAAHTNHALDQLLKHVSIFDPDYIRLGGRSTNIEIRRRVLFEIRQRERVPPIAGSLFKPAQKKLDRQYTKFGEFLSIFDNAVDMIPCEKLLELGIINAKQQQSLLDAANNFVTTDEESQSPMQYWLHKALIPYEVIYGDDNFGFEDAEEDLEIEQLRETEAEHGVADEEDLELLKGQWKPISDDYTIVTPSDNDLERAKQMLDTKQDLWDIPEHLRGPVYLVMKQRAKELLLAKFRQEAKEYCKIAEEIRIGQWERDIVYLRRANIIGLTTTGLSKYRPLVASLKPKIILIEEAAEALEGPVAVACMESVEHLILVGDHQQLQGHCALKELEGEPYYLNISMFERLINLETTFKTLSRQRRMNPEIRELIGSLYPDLQDHNSVLTREKLPQWGTGSIRSFFFYHDWSERRDESFSTLNEEEARMVAKFYRHLLRNGVPPAAITILTFYNGQRKRILRELRDDPETNGTYNNVKTVDSYQGEENEVIILSLVRSNTNGQIGFLGISNRVCVALSRARRGFYLFGNGKLLSEKNRLWMEVENSMSGSNPSRFGPELPLICVNHNRTLTAKWPEDFDRNEGGCDLWCNTTLSCGHKCTLKCHPKPHHLLPCKVQCGKALRCGHECRKLCHEICYCQCEEFQSTLQVQSGVFSNDYVSASPAREMYTSLVGNERMLGTHEAKEEHGNLSRLDQPGKALARGGAAFQPILAQSHLSSYGVRRESSKTAVDASSPEKGEKAANDWTSFAEGGVKEDDVRRRMETCEPGLEVSDLMDLSPTSGACGGVETSVEEKADGGRSRYTQTYRPAVPGNLNSSQPAAKQVSEQSKVGNVVNLMD